MSALEYSSRGGPGKCGGSGEKERTPLSRGMGVGQPAKAKEKAWDGSAGKDKEERGGERRLTVNS